MKDSRTRISYVLKTDYQDPTHTAGINSLIVSSGPPSSTDDIKGSLLTSQTLYSAGRDGNINSWNISTNSLTNDLASSQDTLSVHRHFDPVPTRQFRPRADSEPRRNSYNVSKMKVKINCTYQHHVDWVNDIILCNQGRNLLSASSDCSIKLWTTKNNAFSTSPMSVGQHSDYVKVIAHSPRYDWVVSGGLDRKILFWDLSRCNSFLHVQNPIVSIEETSATSSIYSLACNPSGDVVVSGSPEKIIRVWDPRSGKRTMKLLGHTDNIRSLLVSQDGKMVLSASSDSTVKLWSLVAQRCLVTYTAHSDSVWKLFSSDPNLEVFYSAGRDGLVTKTDRKCFYHRRLNNLDTKWNDTEKSFYLPHNEDGTIEESEGVCIAICKEKSPIFSISVSDEKHVWVAGTSSDITCWEDIPLRTMAKLPSKPYLNSIPCESPNLSLNHNNSNNSVRFSVLSVSGGHNMTGYTLPETDPKLLLRAKSLKWMDKKSGLLSSPINSSFNSQRFQRSPEDEVCTVAPYRLDSICTIKGLPGIKKHAMLNDRQRVVTQDAAGNVDIWDVIYCKHIQSLGKVDMDEVIKKLNPPVSFANWCTVDTRTGSLTIHLEQSTCFSSELYYDETPFAQLEPFYEEDQRRRWVIFGLFRDFLNQYKLETSKIDDSASSIPTDKQIQDASTTTTTAAVKENNFPTRTSSLERTAIPRKASGMEMPIPPAPTYQHSPIPLTYPSQIHVPNSSNTSATSSQPSSSKEESSLPSQRSFRERMFDFAKKSALNSNLQGTDAPSASYIAHQDLSRNATHNSGTSPGPSLTSPESNDDDREATSSAAPENAPITLDQEFPEFSLPPELSVIATEESADACTPQCLYVGTVHSMGQNTKEVLDCMPHWILDFVIRNVLPQRPIVKLSFLLLPDEGSGLPELPSGNNRLTANRMLRSRKLLSYIIEKLSLAPPPRYANNAQIQPEDWIEVICNEKVVPPKMTLFTLRTYLWKTTGDITLKYRYTEKFR